MKKESFMTGRGLEKLFEHNNWANLKII